MEGSLNLEELFALKKKGYRLIVEARMSHNISWMNDLDINDGLIIREGAIGEIVKIEEDESREFLVNGDEDFLPLFPNANKYQYDVKFNNILAFYTSSFFFDPGYHEPHSFNARGIEDLFLLKEAIPPEPPENPNQTYFDFCNELKY